MAMMIVPGTIIVKVMRTLHNCLDMKAAFLQQVSGMKILGLKNIGTTNPTTILILLASMVLPKIMKLAMHSSELRTMFGSLHQVINGFGTTVKNLMKHLFGTVI